MFQCLCIFHRGSTQLKYNLLSMATYYHMVPTLNNHVEWRNDFGCFLAIVHRLRECDGARVTAMLVWGMDEVLLWLVQGMWVVHIVQVLCLTVDECGALDERSWWCM